MKFCTSTAKCVLSMLGFFFFVTGIAVISIGAWTYAEYGRFDSRITSHLVVLPAVILLGAGVFILLLGIIGCIGACKEQKCLLVLFFIFMLVIFVGMVSGGVLAYVYHGNIDSTLKDGISKCMDKYSNSTSCRNDIDYIQQHMKCCGLNNYTDWLEEPWYKQQNETVSYPASCCVNKTCLYTHNDTHLYHEGCHAKLEKGFKQNLGVIAGVAAAIVIIQVIGMIFSCVLLCKKRSEVPYVGLNDPNGMRV